MILIACTDDRMGMAFNRRRQSSDRYLCRELLSRSGGRLWLHPYSAPLFGDPLPPGILCAEDFLEQAGDSDCCFWEARPAVLPRRPIRQIVLYRWNRRYPSDLQFPMDLTKGWELTARRDFPGFSHEIITEETYMTCET